MTLASPKFRRPRKPYRPRKTAPRYLLSCACSLLGNSVAGVILPLVMLATTGDALAAGTLALICAVPQFVIGLIGGALTDRFNRRNVSIVSDILSAASVALLPVVDMVWGLSFGWFVALGLLGAIGDIPGMTARDSLVPAVCERDGRSLQKFMGLAQSLDSLVVIVGPALAAFLMGAGIGSTTTMSGDYDIMTQDHEANQKYGIDRLRFGDLVLIEDHDNTHGPHYRQGAVSIGVIVHSDSFTSGHGPGVTVIMSADEDTLEGIIDPDANIANYMNKIKR